MDIAESFEIDSVPTFLILQVEYMGHTLLILLIFYTVTRVTNYWHG